MGVHSLPLECHESVMTITILVMPDKRCRAALRESTDGVDLIELGREFQSVTVRGKNENFYRRHAYSAQVCSWRWV